MAAVANGLKLVTETVRRHRRLIFWGIILAIVIAIVTSVWTMLVLAYRYGGINTDAFFFNYVNRLPFENAAARLHNLEGPHWANWIYTAIGALVMGLLMVAHQRFLWWPLHPLGFPISAVTGALFFSVLIALVIKSVVLKYGGPKLYLHLKPLFLGMILGQFVTAGCWLVVSYITGVPGGYNYLSGYL